MSSRNCNKFVVKVLNVECTAVWVGQCEECLEIVWDNAYNRGEFVISRTIKIHNVKEPSTF